ncbi:acyl carrier protein [Umezawaea sp. Da 62-37]|uniref:acyl carrier protein n=1 Tax=Umezawaea sp. Da 62-37 TaxID=3075927 RepID=UPI0028F6CD7D|nr:acyl carrier protein [Umezawaea sp. Da 62-37]WNV85124.1 acyl carrier protein [Umezawaea sp. Da 62-37]
MPGDQDRVSDAVKRMVIAESRISLDPGSLREDEPLNGRVLRVTSVGFLSMLIRLEDELDVVLPDDLFAGRTFHTVADLVDVVMPTYLKEVE